MNNIVQGSEMDNKVQGSEMENIVQGYIMDSIELKAMKWTALFKVI